MYTIGSVALPIVLESDWSGLCIPILTQNVMTAATTNTATYIKTLALVLIFFKVKPHKSMFSFILQRIGLVIKIVKRS